MIFPMNQFSIRWIKRKSISNTNIKSSWGQGQSKGAVINQATITLPIPIRNFILSMSHRWTTSHCRDPSVVRT